MYEYTYVCICIDIHTHMSIYLYMHVHLFLHVHMCKLEYIGVNISVCMHVCTCVSVHVSMYVCMHICMSLYMHMCVDIYVYIMCVCWGSFTWTALLWPRAGCHFLLLCWWCFSFCPDPPIESAASHGWPSAVIHMKGLHRSLPDAVLHKCPLPLTHELIVAALNLWEEESNSNTPPSLWCAHHRATFWNPPENGCGSATVKDGFLVPLAHLHNWFTG